MNTGTAPEKEGPKYWETTRLNNLVRHVNGRYYARLYRDGKENNLLYLVDGQHQ